jgi:putative transposase
MSDSIWLSEAQMRRINRIFRYRMRRRVSMIAGSLAASFSSPGTACGGGAPVEYGPHKTIYNRLTRWSRPGVFNKIFAGLAAKGGKPDLLMIDATQLKAHQTAASLLKKGLFPDVSDAPKGA